jgi:hypothetical protein
MAALRNVSPDIGVSTKNLMVTSGIAQCHVFRTTTSNSWCAEIVIASWDAPMARQAHCVVKPCPRGVFPTVIFSTI